MAGDVDEALERLLEFLRDERGFDFTGYKRASLARRIDKRMHGVGITDLDLYHDYLQAHPEEFTHLFNTILINVTRFFRDPESWEFLAREVVPGLVERKGGRGELRVWSVGVASGEEAYTLAMVLAEAVGLEHLRDRVKIYATDVDEEALSAARSGEYAAAAVQAIPEEIRGRYLVQTPSGFVFRKEIRRAVVFGRHDLLNDAPISRVDLIVCRNTLIYFNSDTQSRIFDAFQFALRPDGYLFLGQAERFSARSDRFVPLDPRERVYTRVARDGDRGEGAGTRELGRVGQAAAERLRGAVFDSATTAQIVVDAAGRVVAVNGRSRELFDLAESDIGRVFYELQLSYKPVELRSRIDRAITSRRPTVEQDVPWTTASGQRHHLQVEAVPLFSGEEPLGVMVAFIDVTDPYETSNQLERARRELETAYEEIQSTVEELETTNEELQSTNEELETTNEELQSTNEELETMNEELQSTNEELETMNDELRDRTDETLHANSFLGSVLGSIHQGVVVVDRELRILAWSRPAANLWGLRDDEVEGEHLLNLDIGIPVLRLRDPIRSVLAGSAADLIELDGHDRRGKPVHVRIAFAPLQNRPDGEQPDGAILLVSAERSG